MKKYITSFLFLLFAVTAFSQTVLNFDLLADLRGQVSFPELTGEEKELLAGQVEMVLEGIYSHRYQKIEYYENHEDPVSAIKKIITELHSLSSDEAVMEIYKVITAQRDLHLNFIFPEPYSQYNTFVPLFFDRTRGPGNFFEVRVEEVSSAYFDTFAPGVRIPAVGDEVLACNGKPILEAVREQEETSQGANVYGGFKRAVEQLTFVPQIIHPFPGDDEISFTFRAFGTGEEYSITLPWIVYWSSGEGASGEGSRQAVPSTPLRKIQNKPERDLFYQGTDLWQQLYKGFRSALGRENKSVFPSNPSNESSLKWGIIEDENGRFGYLRIDSFSPSLGTAGAVEEIVRIIFDEFGDTEGLLIDVRDNGGGSLLYAEALAQLFIPGEARVLKARLINTRLMHTLFNETLLPYYYHSDWVDTINASPPEARYTSTVSFFSPGEINSIGQVYYKPVFVLNNAASYSATDMFSCIMRDNYIPVIGEDYTTGAGGANVITYSDFTQIIGEPFSELPEGYDMRFAFSRILRFGKNEGMAIEDYGCEPTLVISPRAEDFLTGGESQLKEITTYMAGWKKRFKTTVVPEITDLVLYQDPGAPGLGVTVSNTKYIKVDVDGTFYDKIYLSGGEEPLFVFIPLPSGIPGVVYHVVLTGQAVAGGRSWNMKRTVISLNETMIVGPEGFSFDFSRAEDLSPFTVVNHSNLPEEGWCLRDGAMTVGYNPGYANSVHTEAVLKADLSAVTEGTLSFDMEIDTEDSYDLFQVSLYDGNEGYLLFSGSGYKPPATYSFDINLLEHRENLLFRFSFVSDSSVTYQGVRITSLELE